MELEFAAVAESNPFELRTGSYKPGTALLHSESGPALGNDYYLDGVKLTREQWNQCLSYKLKPINSWGSLAFENRELDDTFYCKRHNPGGPAYVNKNTIEYYLSGLSVPPEIYPDMASEWRSGVKPTVSYKEKTFKYFDKNGQAHRKYGPAIIDLSKDDPQYKWAWKGVTYNSKEEWNKAKTDERNERINTIGDDYFRPISFVNPFGSFFNAPITAPAPKIAQAQPAEPFRFASPEPKTNYGFIGTAAYQTEPVKAKINPIVLKTDTSKLKDSVKVIEKELDSFSFPGDPMPNLRKILKYHDVESKPQVAEQPKKDEEVGLGALLATLLGGAVAAGIVKGKMKRRAIIKEEQKEEVAEGIEL